MSWPSFPSLRPSFAGLATQAWVRSSVGSWQDDMLDKDKACRMCTCPCSNQFTHSSRRIQVLAWARGLKPHTAVVQRDGKWACSDCAWSGWKPKSLCAAWHILAYPGLPWQTLFRISPALTPQLRFEVPGATRTHRLSLGELLNNGLQARTCAFEILAPLMPPCLGRDFTILRTAVPSIAARADVQTHGLR